jgi:glucose-1-phosphate thymidylyltransferase
MAEPKCDKAVILAAGMGVRVRTLTAGKPKCLMDLAGRPIIDWILGALRRAGVRHAVIVTGFQAAKLRHSVGDGRRYGLSIRYVHNPRWKLPNGISLHAAKKAVAPGERFLTLMSDHLLPSVIIKSVAQAATAACVLAVDTHPGRVFDISDATKVRLTDGVPTAIGKRLRKYNAVDCGLFRFDGRVFTALEAALGEAKMSLTDGVKILIKNGDLEALPIGDDVFWIDIDTPEAYRQATGKLAAPAARRGVAKTKRK